MAKKDGNGDIGTLPWRERPVLRVGVAADVLGVSQASIYRLHETGKLSLKRIAGRVVVETAEVLAVLAAAEPWVKSEAGSAARAKRAAARTANVVAGLRKVR